MNESRICPLLSRAAPGGQHECEKNRCAWYDRAERMCAVLTLALTLDNMDREGIQTR